MQVYIAPETVIAVVTLALESITSLFFRLKVLSSITCPLF